MGPGHRETTKNNPPPRTIRPLYLIRTPANGEGWFSASTPRTSPSLGRSRQHDRPVHHRRHLLLPRGACAPHTDKGHDRPIRVARDQAAEHLAGRPQPAEQVTHRKVERGEERNCRRECDFARASPSRLGPRTARRLSKRGGWLDQPFGSLCVDACRRTINRICRGQRDGAPGCALPGRRVGAAAADRCVPVGAVWADRPETQSSRRECASAIALRGGVGSWHSAAFAD